jgi:gas vesicle protein
MPLHQNLYEQAEKGILTGAAVGSVVVLSVRKESGIEGVRNGVLLLHKQEEDIKNQ